LADKTVVQNRRARHDYHILDSFEAGIELKGTEVKSLRNGQMMLKDSYVDIVKGELFLMGAHIAPYEQGNIYNHEPERPRRLLMHKREILKLTPHIREKGHTLVPLKVYFTRGKAKVQVGLCKGKQTADKRATIQERESKVEMDRAMKEARQDGR
jgi:SsrA-binding protein